MTACRTCASPQVERVNALLLAGDSIRGVSRITGIPRSSLARHAAHIAPVDRRPRIVPPAPIDLAPVDPLAEALALAERATTQRQRLKALEQIRSATALALRRMSQPDEAQLRLLDRNLAAAEEAYRDQATFEEAVRGLQGVREAIRQRLDAVRVPDMIEVPVKISFYTAGEEPSADDDSEPGTPWPMMAETYFRGIPERFRDLERYVVKRTIRMSWHGTGPLSEDIKVYEVGTNALAWASLRTKEEQRA